MELKYTIKNFRCFDESGATINFAPITFLVGPNGSGKSTITKSCLLLQSFCSALAEKLKKGDDLLFDEFEIDFSKGEHNLGNYDHVVNLLSNNENITFEFEIPQTEMWSTQQEKGAKIVFSFQKKQGTNGVKAVLQSCKCWLDDILFYEGEFTQKQPKLYIDNTEGHNNLTESLHIGELKDWFIRKLFLLNKSYIYNELEVSEQSWDERNREPYEPNAQQKYKAFLSRYDDMLEENGYEHWCMSLLRLNFLMLDRKVNISSLRRQMAELNALKYEDDQLQLTHFINESVFNIPILSALEDVKKEHVLAWVEENLYPQAQAWGYGKMFCEELKIIFEDFISSEYETFTKYYVALENEWLKNVPLTHDGIQSLENATKLNFDGTLLSIQGDEACFLHPFASLTQKEIAKESTMSPEEFDAKLAQFRETLQTDKFKIVNKHLQGFKFGETDEHFGLEYCFTPELESSSVQTPDFDILRTFVTTIRNEALHYVCQQLSNIAYSSSLRADNHRIFLFEKKQQITDDIQRYLEIRNNETDSTLLAMMNDVLFSKNDTDTITNIEFELAPQSVGYYVYLTTEKTQKRMILADYGYGYTPILAMLLRLIIIRQQAIANRVRLTIFIEEPENNLHPAMQSRIAEMLDVLSKYVYGYNQDSYVRLLQFVIETHSEYIIRKSQVLVAQGYEEQGENFKNPFRVYYIPKDGKPYDMEYKKDGFFAQEFGKGFFDEAANLAFTIL